MASASATLAVSTALCIANWAQRCLPSGWQRVALQIAQRAAAGLVGAVREHLYRHVGLPADGAEDRAADGVRRVLLAGVVLEHHAAAQPHGRAGVGLLREVRVGRVGVVGASA